MNEFGYEFRVLAFLWITHDPEHDARVDCDSDIIPCFAALDWRIENHELLRDKLRNLDEWAFEVKPSFPHPGTRTCLQLFSIVCHKSVESFWDQNICFEVEDWGNQRKTLREGEREKEAAQRHARTQARRHARAHT